MNLSLSDEQVFLREAARGALPRIKTFEAVREAHRRRNVREEVVQGVHAEELEHRRHVVSGVRQIVSHYDSFCTNGNAVTLASISRPRSITVTG